jgi:nickel transport protein
LLGTVPIFAQRRWDCPLPTRKALRIGLLAVLFCGLLPAASALGHVVNVYAWVEGRQICGEVYFAGRTPAQGVMVRAFDPEGRELAEVTTDSEGEFGFEARFRCDYRLLAEAGEGHAGEYTVPAEELPDDLPLPDGSMQDEAPREESPPLAAPGESDTPDVPDNTELRRMIERAVGEEVAPLRKELHRMETTLRVRDVVGGVGYIFGIMGLLSYYLATRRRGPGAK